MIQKAFFVSNPIEVERMVSDVLRTDEYKTANRIVCEVCSANFVYNEMEFLLRPVREVLKNVEFILLSLNSGGDMVLFGKVQFNFRFFTDSETKINILEYDFNEKDIIDCIGDVRYILSETKDLKAVELYGAGLNLSWSDIIDDITEGFFDVPFYGSLVASAPPAGGEDLTGKLGDVFKKTIEESRRVFFKGGDPYGAFGMPDVSDIISKKFLIDGFSLDANGFFSYKKEVKKGILFIIYSGENLNVYAKKILGWKPIGKELTVTLSDTERKIGDSALSRIDNIPATDIYKKYLGVERGKYFTENVCEFPLVSADDDLRARVPCFNDEDGRLYFMGKFKDGEKIRFSYAVPSELLENTEKESIEMCAFGPESIQLIMCGNRTIFLKQDAHIEVDYYKRLIKDLSVSYGFCEILKYKDNGGVINSTIVSIGMREGEKHLRCEEGSVSFAPRSRLKKFVPLSERLLTFLGQTTAELKDAVKDAEAANEAKSAFLSNMSHEIRTPINAVLGMDEMILRECEDDSIIKYAKDIESAGTNLLGIVNDILDFSKIEAKKMEIIPVEYDMASLINDLVNMIRKRAEDKGLLLSLDIDETIPHLLIGDEVRIKQVVTNILTNAVKYTEKGSVTLSVSCKFWAEEHKRLKEDEVLMHFSVKDTGIGIKEDDLPKLFSAFERIEEKRNRTIEGTGLGMNITENLLDMMGSSLNVKSKYGEGSEFYFDIKQKVVKWEPLGDYEATLKKVLGTRKKYKESFHAPDALILAVDDTVMNLTVIVNLLKKTKIRVDTAASGAECLEKCKNNKYDCIFLDHRMPEMDGIETLNELKKDKEGKNFDTPLIALTANAVSGAREMYIKAGFLDYLTKPINPEKLEGILSEYLPDEKIIPYKEELLEDDEEKKDIKKGDIIKNYEIKSAKHLPLWLRARSDIDLYDGINKNGSAEAFLQVLTLFTESIEENADLIEKYYLEKDIKNYTIKVHALKSSSRMVGINTLSALSEELEKAGDEEDLEKIEDLTPLLLTMYRQYLSAFSELLNEKENDALDKEKELLSDDMWDDAMRSLFETAQGFDYDTLSFIFDSLSSYRIRDDKRDVYDALKNAVKNTDWDKINLILNGELQNG